MKASNSISGTAFLISSISDTCNSLARMILFTHKSAQNFTLSEFNVVVWVDKWRGIFGKYFLIILNVHGSENMILSAPQSAIFSVID